MTVSTRDKRCQEYAGISFGVLPFAASVAMWNHPAPVWRWSLFVALLLTATLASINFVLRSGQLKGEPVAPSVQRHAAGAYWLCLAAVVVTGTGTVVSLA
jgi:hypothetical protein